jgi:hypothetical protein
MGTVTGKLMDPTTTFITLASRGETILLKSALPGSQQAPEVVAKKPASLVWNGTGMQLNCSNRALANRWTSPTGPDGPFHRC